MDSRRSRPKYDDFDSYVPQMKRSVTRLGERPITAQNKYIPRPEVKRNARRQGIPVNVGGSSSSTFHNQGSLPSAQYTTFGSGASYAPGYNKELSLIAVHPERLNFDDDQINDEDAIELIPIIPILGSRNRATDIETFPGLSVDDRFSIRVESTGPRPKRLIKNISSMTSVCEVKKRTGDPNVKPFSYKDAINPLSDTAHTQSELSYYANVISPGMNKNYPAVRYRNIFIEWGRDPEKVRVMREKLGDGPV